MLMQSVGISDLDSVFLKYWDSEIVHFLLAQGIYGNPILLESCLMRWHFFYEASNAVYKTVKNITNASVDWGTTTVSNGDIQGSNLLFLLLYV